MSIGFSQVFLFCRIAQKTEEKLCNLHKLVKMVEKWKTVWKSVGKWWKIETHTGAGERGGKRCFFFFRYSNVFLYKIRKNALEYCQTFVRLNVKKMATLTYTHPRPHLQFFQAIAPAEGSNVVHLFLTSKIAVLVHFIKYPLKQP